MDTKENGTHGRLGKAGLSRHHWVALPLAVVAVAMLGLAYASVPLYRLFCQATGYGGTTQRAEVAPKAASHHVMTIRFDSNIDPDLPWSFTPAVATMQVRIGESSLAFYRAHNQASQTVAGTASFNVTPEIAGQYFSKLECFCFTEQVLAAGESVEMPVSFFVDPAILQDPDSRGISEITLSYTFHRSETTTAGAKVEPVPPQPAGG